jgi:hypothetical protein
MKNKKNKTKKVATAVPVGRVLNELVIWEFSEDEAVICHIVDQVSKAILMTYHLRHFGAASFGISEE